MSDTERLAEIRARVAAATPGPWHMAICCDEHGEVEGYANIEAGNRDVANEASDDDAALIANAPADLAYLLAEVARLRERVAELEGAVSEAHEAIGDLYDADGVMHEVLALSPWRGSIYVANTVLRNALTQDDETDGASS